MIVLASTYINAHLHSHCPTEIFLSSEKLRTKSSETKPKATKKTQIDMDSGVSTGTKCGRWSPTTEQVKVLSDLFKSGLRTPSTDQIQKISSQLSFYGKIESKNVFYWFQNHKARERQKRRRVVRDTDENDVFHKAPVKSLVDVNKVLEPERVIQTLQLFPLNAFGESKSDKMGLMKNECKDTKTRFSYLFETGMNYPPLDLRLSFL